MYFFVRGKFEQVELWKAHAQTAYWKWRRTNLDTGEEELTLIQGALRPSVLGAYEYIFPKEALKEVCAFFGINKEHLNGSGLSKIGINIRHLALRKIFGCKKIPKKIIEEAKQIPDNFSTKEFERGGHDCKVPGVCLHVIGIKGDTMIDLNGYHQEGL